MVRILLLLQIKTVRSAWVFLIGSGILFAFGAYQAFRSVVYPIGDQEEHSEIPLFVFWFVVLSAYMVTAGWALFTAKGRDYLATQEQVSPKGSRTALWYIKFLFACYAAALATMIVLPVLSLPLSGYAALDPMFGPNWGMYLLAAALVWAPLVFRYLE